MSYKTCPTLVIIIYVLDWYRIPNVSNINIHLKRHDFGNYWYTISRPTGRALNKQKTTYIPCDVSIRIQFISFVYRRDIWAMTKYTLCGQNILKITDVVLYQQNFAMFS